MPHNRQSRRIRQSRQACQTRRGRRNRRFPLFPALVIEGLAVAAILFLFVTMRADLNHQARVKMMGAGVVASFRDFRELAQHDSLRSGKTRPVSSATSVTNRIQDQWNRCWN